MDVSLVSPTPKKTRVSYVGAKYHTKFYNSPQDIRRVIRLNSTKN